jgi:hypothetical protein
MQEKLKELLKEDPNQPPGTKRRHPYTLENTPEETIRRMRSFPERAAKFLAELKAKKEEESNADRKEDSR